MDPATLNARLDEVDKTLGALVPLVSQGAAVIRIVGTLLRPKMTPDQQKLFDDVIKGYDDQNAQLQSAIDRLRAASSSMSNASTQSTSDHPGD